MRSYDVLIIGGGIAGYTAAETYRRGGGKGTVAIVSDERHPLYSRVLLPHAVKEKVPSARVHLKDESAYEALAVDHLSGVTAVSVDPDKRRIGLDDGRVFGFGQLVVATGGRPKVWEVPGATLDGVMRLQTYEDAEAVKERAKLDGGMVIVGSGFIALEFASIAAHYAMPATLLHRGERFCSSLLGDAAAEAAARILSESGVELRSDTAVARVEGDGEVAGVVTEKNESLACSIVGVGIGLDLNIEPFSALGAGKRGLLADETLMTEHEGIWVAGDCAEFSDPLLGIRHVVGNWTNAMAQGRHAGQALLGDRKPFELLTAYTSVCVEGLGLVFIGETRNVGGSRKVERVIEPGRRVAEFHLLEGRMIGATLLNAPELRRPIETLIRSRADLSSKEGDLSDPDYPLAGPPAVA